MKHNVEILETTLAVSNVICYENSNAAQIIHTHLLVAPNY